MSSSSPSSSLSSSDVDWNSRNTNSTSYKLQIIEQELLSPKELSFQHFESDLNIELRQPYFKQFDTDEQLFLFKNIFFKCLKITKGDYNKTNNMMNQIVQEVHINVESEESSNNNYNSTNNMNLIDDKKRVKKLVKKSAKKFAKIHGHKSKKKYKKLLKSYDPILNNNELVMALSDPEGIIWINDKIPDDLGTTMSNKAKNHDVNDKSEVSFASISTPNGTKFSILHAANSSTMESLKIPNIFKDLELNDISNIEKLPDDNKGNEQQSISTESSEHFDETNINESIQASSSKVEIRAANFSLSNYGQECSYIEQPNHLLEPITTDDCAASPITTIYMYHYKNRKDFLKLKKIIFKYDFSSNETFKKLVYVLKKTFNYYIQKIYKLNYMWHSPKIHVIKKLLKELLQTLNQTRNKIIHFMTFLNILFRKSVDTSKMKIFEIYYSFFGFADFIKRCLLSHDNTMAMEWIPTVWNNCFYYSLILVEYILFNNSRRMNQYTSIQTLFEWSYIPNIEKLLKILSYNNNKRSASIKSATDDINYCLKQHPQNTIQPEHQDMLEEPPRKKKKKSTSYQQRSQQAQQSAELTVRIDESTAREAQAILSSIAQRMYDNTHIIKTNDASTEREHN